MPIFRLAIICLVFLSGLTANAADINAKAPSPKDKCPVCGMFVSKYPDWAVAVTFKDGSTLFFDGARDFLTYYHSMKKYTPLRSQSDISLVTLKDYYALKSIEARKAFFVTGSDVYGPMGRELVPFEKTSDAQAFLKDHKGKKILSFSEVTQAVLKSIE